MSAELQVSVGRRTLDRARFFLGQAEMSDPNSERSALENYIAATVVFGRSVTFHLQAEYKRRDGFDGWWKDRQTEMRADPVLRFFLEMRNIELKVGPVGVRRLVSIELNATATMINDLVVSEVRRAAPIHRRGLKILAEDTLRWLLGPVRALRRWLNLLRERRVTVSAAASESQITDDRLFFDDPDLGQRPAFELLGEYLDKLEGVVEATEVRFGAGV